jgi:hypothetical protein
MRFSDFDAEVKGFRLEGLNLVIIERPPCGFLSEDETRAFAKWLRRRIAKQDKRDLKDGERMRNMLFAVTKDLEIIEGICVAVAKREGRTPEDIVKIRMAVGQALMAVGIKEPGGTP